MQKSLVSISFSLLLLAAQLGLPIFGFVANAASVDSKCEHCSCGGSNCCVGDAIPDQDLPPAVPWSGERTEKNQPLWSWVDLRQRSERVVVPSEGLLPQVGKRLPPNVPIFVFACSFLI